MSRFLFLLLVLFVAPTFPGVGTNGPGAPVHTQNPGGNESDYVSSKDSDDVKDKVDEPNIADTEAK